MTSAYAIEFSYPKEDTSDMDWIFTDDTNVGDQQAANRFYILQNSERFWDVIFYLPNQINQLKIG